MTEPTDDELDAVIAEYRTRIYPQDMHPRFERAIMRAAIAKWGTPPAVAGEPVAWWIPKAEQFTLACKSGDRPFAKAWEPLYATPQPTQAQAGVPCRKNPFYHGPRNCSRGTVGCCEDHGTATQAQAGAMPRPVTAAEHEVLMAAARDNMTLVAKGRLVESPEEQAADSVLEDAARLEALHAAVTAIYLDDSSDFKSALGAVVRHLDPKLAGDLLAWPKRAYDISQARLDAARKQGANHD